MSKKDRLKAQKEKQDKLRHEAELNEKAEKENALEGHSKAAAKMLKKSKKHGICGEPSYYLILKILLILPYAYSAFFYGGVTVVGTFGGYITPTPPKWVGFVMIAGMVTGLAGILFAFFKKYIVSFILCVAATVCTLRSGFFLVKKIQEILKNNSVDSTYASMDKEYMWRYYPVAAFAVISFALLVCTIIRMILHHRAAQLQKDTAPVDSII